MSELDIVPAESLPDSFSSLDAEGQELRALAEKSDSGEITNEAEDTDTTETKTENSTKEDQQRAAEAGKEKTEAKKPDSPEASAEPESSYQKRKSERDKAADDAKRLADNWKKFDEEKKATRAEVAQLRQLVQQVQQQTQRPQQQPQPRFSSQHLAQAVDEFEATGQKALAEGDTETAQKNFDLARKARTAAQESYYAEQQEAYQGALSQHEKSWRGTAAEVIREHPELADQATEASQNMQKLLQAYPILGEMPDGFKIGYQWLSDRMAAEASGLKDEKIASLEKQLKELQERTQITGSGPTPRSERNPGDMSLDEEGEFLRRQVAEADRAAYA